MEPSPAWKAEPTFSPLDEPETPSQEPEISADVSTAWSSNIATLVERFNEPLGGASSLAPAIARPAIPPRLSVVPSAAAASPRPDQKPAHAPEPAPFRRLIPSFKSLGVPAGTLIPGLVGLAVVPMSFAFFLWWQDSTPSQESNKELALAAPAPDAAPPAQSAGAPAITLSVPGRIEANANGTVAFPIAIDAGDTLPARSIVAVSGLPQGATFSQGRPYGDTGWSLGSGEIAGLQLRLPPESGASDIGLELIAGDGTVLAQSVTRLSITPPQVATTDEATVGVVPVETTQAYATLDAPTQENASAEMTGSITPTPMAPAADAPEVKVNTVKTVAVEPPREAVPGALPHNGAYALGTAAEEPAAPEEWMETKTAVDMHAGAAQKSETVKVAQGGLKVRVMGRDKNWVQVHDPKSETTGWIYNRFLKEAEAPAN